MKSERKEEEFGKKWVQILDYLSTLVNCERRQQVQLNKILEWGTIVLAKQKKIIFDASVCRVLSTHSFYARNHKNKDRIEPNLFRFAFQPPT